MQFIQKLLKYLSYLRDLLNGNGPFASKYKFENRKKNKRFLLYVLAGYKPFLWEDVFERIVRFKTENIEVCVLSSGKYSSELSEICRKNDFSYLSTKRNNICIISNIALRLFDKAEFVFKMDEDMYLTEGVFEELLRIYKLVEQKENCEVGIVGPFVPINSFCLDFFIRENGLEETFQKEFGKMKKCDCIRDEERFRSGNSIDSYIWSITGNIDEYSKYRQKNVLEDYKFCTFRYMIGFTLFKRSLWRDMGYFKVSVGKGSGTEGDEGQILTYCYLMGYAIVCAMKNAVGHFSFGGCEKDVMKLREQKPEIFNLLK